jgi:uncharacterized protein (TIGR02265 family)
MASESIHFTVDASTPLTGEIDAEALIAAMPGSYTMRGMFFGPFMERLGNEFHKLLPLLRVPPNDRYFALAAYPTHDFVRVFDAAARRAHPDCGGREAYRRSARRMVEIFQQTLLGKAMFSVIHDPVTLLRRYPETCSVLSTGFRARASQRGPNAMAIELKEFFGSVEFMLGMLESFVLLFGLTPTTEVRSLAPNQLEFLISWH